MNRFSDFPGRKLTYTRQKIRTNPRRKPDSKKAEQVFFQLTIFRKIFENAGDALIVLNRQARILDINRAGRLLLSQNHSSASRNFSQFLPPRKRDSFLHALARVSSSKSTETIDLTVTTPFHQRNVHATISVLDPAKGLVILDLHDVSELEHALTEKQQQETVTALAGATAHKLNQPLTAVLGYLQMMQRTDPTLADHHDLGKIESAAIEIAELVREIGRITKFETRTYGSSNEILEIKTSDG